MGYKVQTKIRIDLGDLGDNQGTPFFVEIKNPKLMTFGDREQFKKLTNAVDQVDAGMEFLRKLIVSWNLLDVETEQPIQLSDENAMYRIPMAVITKISQSAKFGQDDETKNSSEQSAKS